MNQWIDVCADSKILYFSIFTRPSFQKFSFMMENCLLVHSYGFSLVDGLVGEGTLKLVVSEMGLPVISRGIFHCKTLSTGMEWLGDKVFPSDCLFADFNISCNFWSKWTKMFTVDFDVHYFLIMHLQLTAALTSYLDCVTLDDPAGVIFYKHVMFSHAHS